MHSDTISEHLAVSNAVPKDDRHQTVTAHPPESTPNSREKQRSLRFQCTGTIEFWVAGEDAPIRGNLTDVSLHGCYAEVPTAVPANTPITLDIESLGVRFHTDANVRVSYPSLGVGICFSHIEPEQQAQLQRLLKSLANERAHIAHSSDISMHKASAAEAEACLHAISDFFQNNDTLSRDEFQAIAKRVCGSAHKH